MMAVFKRIKRFLIALAACTLVFAFAGCGVYTPPSGVGGDEPPVIEPAPPTPPTPGLPSENAFTVQLMWKGLPFTSETYRHIEDVRVQWTDKETKQVYRANFDKNGVAAREDLDGDYKVTLVELPDGYTYEPNSYEASNNFKSVNITLFELSSVGLRELYMDTPYYKLKTIGAYRITLESPEDKVLLNFTPNLQGVYSLLSMVDVTANEVNPLLEVYNGILPFFMTNQPTSSRDGGGAENTYTRNINWEYTISADMTGGSNGLIFKLFTTCRNRDAYPMTIDFIIDRDGDFRNETMTPEVQKPTEDFTKTPPKPAGTFTYCAYRDGVVNRTLDEKTVKLNEDGYYYYYTETRDPVTGETVTVWGDRLYARLAAANEVTNFADERVAVHNLEGRNYYQFLRGANGYLAHCQDGCYPVTAELKQFLQDYAVANRIFNDGEGQAEYDSGPNYNSDEESMWMFACGFYKS